MDHSNPEILKDPGGELGLTTDWEHSESFCAEKEQKRCSFWTDTEDVSINGCLSQSSISRSLQRAEVLFKNTFNPSLKWLFQGRSEDEEEDNFVAAHNLVSRSSGRLLRLQQVLLTLSAQWQLLGRTHMASPQGHYRALQTLLQQRSSLIFIHEFSRRSHLAAAFTARVTHLLEHHLETPQQIPSSWSPSGVGLGLLSQELRVHLNHWSCLFSKVQSDQYLRHILTQQNNLLMEVKQTLDLLGLQALVVMEQYVHAVLSAAAQTELDSVPREVLEDIVAGAQLYNQAVEEQKVQHSAAQLRTAVLQDAHYYSTLGSGLKRNRRSHPSAFSVKEILSILAVHHAEVAAQQLHIWAFDQSSHICWVHPSHEVCSCSDTCRSQESSWEQLQHAGLIPSPHFCIHHSTLHSSCCHSCSRTPPVYVPDLHLDSTFWENRQPISVQHREQDPKKPQTGQNQTCISQSGLTQTNVEHLDSVTPNQERQTQFKSCKHLQTVSCTPTSFQHLTALPLSRVFQLDRSSVQLLFQMFSSPCSDLLAHLVSPTPEGPPDQPLPTTVPDMLNGKTESRTLCDPVINTTHPVHQYKDQHVEEPPQIRSEQEIRTGPDAPESFQRNGDSEKEVSVQFPHSVQWSDVGQSLLFADLLGQYQSLLWTLCSRSLCLQLQVSHQRNAAASINLQDKHMSCNILHRIGQASASGLVPQEGRTMLEDISVYLLITAAHVHWDYVVCRSLGSSLKDQCLTNRGTNSVMPTSKQDGSLKNSVTVELLLLLPPPLQSSLSCHHMNSRASGPLSFSLQRQTISLVLASVQTSTVWIISKAQQFLSSWSLNKFLLITQGDLNVVMESLEMMVNQTKRLVMNSDLHLHSTFHNHNQLLLGQQTAALDRAVSDLQTFSSLVLKTFSSDCKRMSGEIFERTMPSAAHWKPSNRTDFPSSPSEYASLAAQTVIGQVLEGVAPLSDDARVQALSITMTAFMEAWMEHILKQKIKFSIHGALQLKQDFDSIRDMIQSDRYGLSSELHQRLLSLRVFQQVDSAVVCLLQQPQAKLYLQPRTWEPFKHCCPAHSSRDSMDASMSSSITSLRCVDGEDVTHCEPPGVTSHLPPVDPSSPTEPYLAPSVSLGAAQQEWLDLRIQSGARRWRLPGLQCVSKSEP